MTRSDSNPSCPFSPEKFALGRLQRLNQFCLTPRTIKTGLAVDPIHHAVNHVSQGLHDGRLSALGVLPYLQINGRSLSIRGLAVNPLSAPAARRQPAAFPDRESRLQHGSLAIARHFLGGNHVAVDQHFYLIERSYCPRLNAEVNHPTRRIHRDGASRP